MLNLITYEMKKLFNNTFGVAGCIFMLVLLTMIFLLNGATQQAYDWQKDTWVNGKEAIALWQQRAEMLDGPLTPQKLDQLQADVDTAAARASELGIAELPNKEAVAAVGSQEAADTLGVANNYLYNAILRIKQAYPEAPTFKDALYEKLTETLEAGHTNGSGYTPEEKETWDALFSQIKEPLTWGFQDPSSSLLLYAGFFALIIMGACIMVSGIFSKEYQDGTAAILLCTKRGRKGLITAKLVAALLFSGLYWVCAAGIAALVSIAFFGAGSFSLPVQVAFMESPYPITCGEMLLIYFGLGLLMTWGCVSVALFLSSICKSTLPPAIISALAIFLAALFGGAIPQITDLLALAPWNALEMMGSRLISYQIGSLVFILPVAIAILYTIVTPVFLGLAAWRFRVHQVA